MKVGIVEIRQPSKLAEDLFGISDEKLRNRSQHKLDDMKTKFGHLLPATKNKETKQKK